jgi:hypothetical protein
MHELVHHFNALHFGETLPRWINEGFAMFFEKFIGFRADDGSVWFSFGYFSPWRLALAQKSLERFDLLANIEGSVYDPCPLREFFLYMHKKNMLQRFLEEYPSSPDASGKTTLCKIWGKTVPEVETEWKDWVKAQPFDENAKLVKTSFIKEKTDWLTWLAERPFLEWDEAAEIFRAK